MKLPSKLELQQIAPTHSSCDDPSGVLIPSTTQYSQLYRVEPSYTE